MNSPKHFKPEAKYVARDYRNLLPSHGWVAFEVRQEETDLYILARRQLAKSAKKAVRRVRSEIEAVIAAHPEFKTAEKPLKIPGVGGVTGWMLAAASRAGVGPMAAVAGAVAQYVGQALRELSESVIVENGGDIYLNSSTEVTVGIFAGPSPLTGKMGLKLSPCPQGLGVCTSSGTVGHSKSYGCADAIVIISEDTALADAVATAAGNHVQSPDDLAKAVDFARGINGVKGIVAICDSKFAAWGDVELVPVS